MSDEGVVAAESEEFSDDINEDGNARDGSPMYDLRLYVAGQSPRSGGRDRRRTHARAQAPRADPSDHR